MNTGYWTLSASAFLLFILLSGCLFPLIRGENDDAFYVTSDDTNDDLPTKRAGGRAFQSMLSGTETDKRAGGRNFQFLSEPAYKRGGARNFQSSGADLAEKRSGGRPFMPLQPEDKRGGGRSFLQASYSADNLLDKRGGARPFYGNIGLKRGGGRSFSFAEELQKRGGARPFQFNKRGGGRAFYGGGNRYSSFYGRGDALPAVFPYEKKNDIYYYLNNGGVKRGGGRSFGFTSPNLWYEHARLRRAGGRTFPINAEDSMEKRMVEDSPGLA